MLIRILAGAVALAAVSAAQAQTAPTTDDFVTAAAAGGNAEVEAGRIAATKGSDKRVKRFGERMVKDHTKANADLMKIVKAEQKPAPSTELNSDGKSLVDKLNSTSAPDFDRTYIDAMVEDHDKDVTDFQSYAKSGDDPKIKAFARRTLAVIKRHDAMAHSIQKAIEKTSQR